MYHFKFSSKLSKKSSINFPCKALSKLPNIFSGKTAHIAPMTLLLAYVLFQPALVTAAERALEKVSSDTHQDISELDETIVTASPIPTSASDIPHNVSIITAQDIERSNAVSLADLLSREANLNLKSFSGTDKNTSIDMRGMGDTAVSNVLILLDGVRLNESDLSGADLSTIAVAQIDRVEIIRGGGAVLYGNGAVGGVINIISKKSKPNTNKFNVEVARGSYDMQDLRASAQVSNDFLAASLNASNYQTDGFRKNGGLDSRNASFELRMLPIESFSFLTAFLRVAHHEDAYGFPGPIGADAFKRGTSARRATLSPFDYGTTKDDIYTVGLSADFEQVGRLDWTFTARDRTNDYVIGFNPGATIEEQQASIQSRRDNMTLKYSVDLKLANMPVSFVTGIDTLSADYVTYNANKFQPGTLRKKGDINSQGLFASTTIKPSAALDLTAGIRSERVNSGFGEAVFDRPFTNVSPFPRDQSKPNSYLPNGNNSKKTSVNQGVEFGAVWQIDAAWKAFASWSKHFRTPNIDELALASKTLKEQTGKTVELGLRYRPTSKLEGSFTVFNILNSDEIYFESDPAGGDAGNGIRGRNRNYDQKTERTGAEVEMRWRLRPSLSLKANAGYVLPQFDHTNADIPNVPRTTANIQMEYSPVTHFAWIFAGRYVGSRFDGNDFNNNLYAKLPAYTVYDTSMRLSYEKADFIAGINNLFDKAYSTLGYSATYYPMPERNAFLRLRLKF